MRIKFDPAKRGEILNERGLDFRDAMSVFSGRTATVKDTRFNYDEPRFITAGHLSANFVVIVWTKRGKWRRIISMRHAHGKEAKL